MTVQACSKAATRRLAAARSAGAVVVMVPPQGARRLGGAAAVVLEGDWWLGVELGQQGAGVAGAEPSSGGQLASADRRAVGAKVGVGALGLGTLGHHLGPGCLLAAGSGRLGRPRRRPAACGRSSLTPGGAGWFR
jgi:hypothetical protein